MESDEQENQSQEEQRNDETARNSRMKTNARIKATKTDDNEEMMDGIEDLPKDRYTDGNEYMGNKLKKYVKYDRYLNC